MTDPTLDELCINTIRFLSVDAVQKAKSGHPGTPMGAATLSYVLWDRFLKHNPVDPRWPNRDRFVLSAGHASMLLYSLLYLTGYDISLDSIKQFRQWGSTTPGHPEFGLTPGVEATTGPLGQGFANGIGMAIAGSWQAQRYNRPGYDVIDHYIYALVSDGDLQEGVASEAASLAGNLQLGKVIYLYDSNDVQQDGPTVSFKEDVSQRFRAYGWNVIGPINGMDIEAVNQAIIAAQTVSNRPNLVICRTVIGYGSPHKAGTNAAHGEPLGENEVHLAKENLQWNYQEPFFVPQQVLDHMRKAQERGRKTQEQWLEKLESYRKAFPQEASQLEAELEGNLPSKWEEGLSNLFQDITRPVPTREASGKVMNIIAEKIPSFVGGAADLAGSTRTFLEDYGDFSPSNRSGRNIRYGLREHAMGAITNGIALHGGAIPFAATFLIFSDYMRPPMRLAAVMKLHVIYVFSHDSIGLGEDGPTHQPVEQLMGLRAIPGFTLIRPADATETVEAWKIALGHREGPIALVFTRQGVPVLDRSVLAPAESVRRGGYILWESGTPPRAILIGSGSEVHIALEAGKILGEKGVAVRVVSLPSWEIFDSQPLEYRNSVLSPEITARVSIEAGATCGWERYVGTKGLAIGVDRFGASAPGKVLFEKFGLTSQHMVEVALQLVTSGSGNGKNKN
jgi:transketolase